MPLTGRSPPERARMSSYPELQLLINGAWKSSSVSEPVYNPADGSVAGALPHASRADLDEAVAGAVEGQKAWAALPPIEREATMMRAAHLLKERTKEIALALVLDQGKTMEEAYVEVSTAHDRIIWDAAEGRRMYGRIVPGRPGVRQMVTRHAVGV